MLVTAIRALGNGRGTDIGIERRLVLGEARRIAANVAKLPKDQKSSRFITAHSPNFLFLALCNAASHCSRV
jgi:hypothetical protein